MAIVWHTAYIFHTDEPVFLLRFVLTAAYAHVRWPRVPPGATAIRLSTAHVHGRSAPPAAVEEGAAVPGGLRGCLLLRPSSRLGARDALKGEKRSDRRLEEVAKAVGGGYCRVQMPLRPALGVRETVAGHRLGALEGEGVPPPLGIPGG